MMQMMRWDTVHRLNYNKTIKKQQTSTAEENQIPAIEVPQIIQYVLAIHAQILVTNEANVSKI